MTAAKYRGVTLRHDAYPCDAWTRGNLEDDGHIDLVSVERVILDQRHGIRLTGREVACVVIRAAQERLADRRIADLIGRGATPLHVRLVRDRHNIDGIDHQYDEDRMCRLILEPKARAKASVEALRAAGITS